MSIEQAVRERHAFEDRLTNFLTLASIMADREIELALSRLADMLANMGDNTHVKFRGLVLKSYFDLRRKNIRQQRVFKRIFFPNVTGMPPFDHRIDKDQADHFVRSIANFTLLTGNEIAAPKGPNDQPINETVLLLAP